MPGLSIMIKPVSSLCNMRCKYCFYSDVSSHREHANMGRMSIDTLQTIVRRALRYADGPVSFAFQGGEPTLAGLEFYEALVRFEREYNSKGLAIHNAIQSNGYDVSDEMIDFFRREHFLVGISLDGTEELHNRLRIDAKGEGTYLRVKDTLKRLQKAEVDFNILCVVNKYVATHAKEVFKALSPYGFLQFIACLDSFDGEAGDYSLTPELYRDFLQESFALYEQAFRSKQPVSIRNFDNYISILLGNQPENCGMSGRCAQYYLIEADGSVYPCDFYVLDKWRLGNIKEASFSSLGKTETATRFMQDSLHMDATCRSCPWLHLCRGGCRRDREPFIDGLPGQNRWCSAYSAFFESCYDKLLKIADNIRNGESV